MLHQLNVNTILPQAPHLTGVKSVGFHFVRYLIYYIIILRIWRLSCFTGAGYILVAIVLIIGAHYLRNGIRFFDFPASKAFVSFFLGIIISYTLGVADTGSFYEFHKLCAFRRTWGIFIGFTFFSSMIIFIRKKDRLIEFIRIALFVAACMAVMTILDYDKKFISLLWSGYGEDDVYYKLNSGMMVMANTFDTMNSNTYGGIISGFFILSLFILYYKPRAILPYVYLLIFFITILQTASRVSSVKLVISSLAFFYFISDKHKIQFLVLVSIFLILSYNLYLFFDPNLALLARWMTIWDNLSDLLTGNLQYGADTFQNRLIMAISGFPSTLGGWIFGTGGIITGFAFNWATSDHIEYTCWLTQYGLITFLPMIFFQFKLFQFFRKIKFEKIEDKKSYNNIKLLRSAGIALLIGLCMEMLSSPTFIMFWIWMGLITCISLVIKDIARTGYPTRAGTK